MRKKIGRDDWMDWPIPFLRGKPPALAIRTEERRTRVIELLEGYEDLEKGLAEDEERASVRIASSSITDRRKSA